MLNWMQSLLAHDGCGVVFIALFLNNLGLPLPGNTLLLAAGFMVGRDTLSLWATIGAATGGTFLGTTCSYWLGRRYGHSILKKFHWLRLTRERVRHIKHFFKRYGAKGVFFAQFVMLLHPFIGILAGLGKTPRRPFFLYNLAGSTAYAFLFTLAGDYFGTRWGFPAVWRFYTILYFLILVVVIIGLNHFWGHDIYTFFGHPFYKRKGKGFWGKFKDRF